MNPDRLRAARWTCIVFALCVATACSKPPSESRVEPSGGIIEVTPELAADEDGLGQAWLSYALARRIWIDSAYLEAYPHESAYRYSFPEEVYARESMARIWAKVRKGHDFTDPYLIDLLEIVDAGFIREYCWVCLNDPSWRLPDSLRNEAFLEWFAESMPEHRVESWVLVRQTPAGPILTVGVRSHPPVPCLNAEGADGS